RPRLVEHVRQRDHEGDERRHLDRHHERRDHAGGDHGGALRQRRHEWRGEEVVARPRAGVEEEHHEEEEHRSARAHEPLAQLHEVGNEAFLVAHAGLFFSSPAASGASATLAACTPSSAPGACGASSFACGASSFTTESTAWLSSVSVLLISDLTEFSKLVAVSRKLSRILRSSSSSISRLMSAFTSLT